jgi:hypothetical protein
MDDGPGQDADAMARPDRVVVPEALGVVPHAVRVDDPAARLLGDREHAAVHMGGHAGDHGLGRGAEPGRPVLPYEIVVGADAAGGDDHDRGAQLELADDRTGAGLAAGGAARLQDRAAYAGDGAARGHEPVDAVPELEGHLVGLDRGPHLLLERLDDRRSRAPGDVEAGHGVAVSVRETAAPLGPADDREPLHPEAGEPGALLTGGEVDVRLGPLVGPVVLALRVGDAAVEAGRALPVLPGQLLGVLDAHESLLVGVDEEQTAEGPERLSAEVRLRFLVQEQYLAARRGQFRRGDQPGEPAADDDRVRVRRRGGEGGSGRLGQGGAGERAARHRQGTAARDGSRGC